MHTEGVKAGNCTAEAEFVVRLFSLHVQNNEDCSQEGQEALEGAAAGRSGGSPGVSCEREEARRKDRRKILAVEVEEELKKIEKKRAESGTRCFLFSSPTVEEASFWVAARSALKEEEAW